MMSALPINRVLRFGMFTETITCVLPSGEGLTDVGTEGGIWKLRAVQGRCPDGRSICENCMTWAWAWKPRPRAK